MNTSRVIPIFPLPLVQFPGALTPLHIFEPRYRKMLKDVMDSDKTFGIIYRQDEAILDSDRPALGSVGCAAEVAMTQGLPDGRSNILCVGGMRCRLLNYVEGEPYLQSEVEFFEDEPVFTDLSAEAERARSLFERMLQASRKMKDVIDRDSGDFPDLPDNPMDLSFMVTAYLDIAANEKQGLLEMTDTAERLVKVTGILETLTQEYEQRAMVHQIAKTNGHGHKLNREG